MPAKARIETDPGVVTPMTMMVLAIRLYDVGLRDDALFWFYAAKARYTTLEDVIDIRLSGLIGPSEAVKSFAVLAGPGDQRLRVLRPRANNMRRTSRRSNGRRRTPIACCPCRSLTARDGDRAANLKKSIAEQKIYAERERARFDDPKFADCSSRPIARRNEADDKFCWK